jgi:hypothetical protein
MHRSSNSHNGGDAKRALSLQGGPLPGDRCVHLGPLRHSRLQRTRRAASCPFMPVRSGNEGPCPHQKAGLPNSLGDSNYQRVLQLQVGSFSEVRSVAFGNRPITLSRAWHPIRAASCPFMLVRSGNEGPCPHQKAGLPNSLGESDYQRVLQLQVNPIRTQGRDHTLQ